MLSILLLVMTAIGANADVAAILEHAKTEHARAQAFSEWHQSDLSPDALAERLQDLESSPGFVTEACAAINALTLEDHYYVMDYLEARAHLAPCLKTELKRYQDYLGRLSRKPTYRVAADANVPKKTLGPSQLYKVDATQTPVLIDGGLPNKVLSLTFDDGPHALRTPKLLEILREENLQVNFFLVGSNTVLYNDIVRQQQKEGHEVGCHSFTHPDMRKLTLAKAVAEIEDGFSAIEKALGFAATLFRFPYGAKTTDLRNYLIKTQTPEFFWNIDTWDWKYKDPEFLLNYALEQIHAEKHGIILFHDIQPQTIAIMPALLAQLKTEGYKFAVFRPSTTRMAPAP